MTIGSCTHDTALWYFDESLGEVVSYALASTNTTTGLYKEHETVCMTTGWPFLQMGAFVTPSTSSTATGPGDGMDSTSEEDNENGGSSKKTVVILNEANDPANYVLVDNGELIVTGSIPARTVQTFQLQDKIVSTDDDTTTK